MNRFEVLTPVDLAHASRLLAERGRVALAGGVDLVDLMKQNVVAPESLVNLKGLPGMDAIEPAAGGGLRIGALAKLHDVANNAVVRQRFEAVAIAAEEAATPQIRNLATVGGNLLQRPRCWYFRNPEIQCLKKGGNKCYAVGGLNRYHAILGGGPSFIVHPSNLAPALMAFDASVRLSGPSGERTVAREKLLEPGEVLTEVIIPAPPRGARSVYLEAREKQSYDWPLVSVATVIVVDHGRVVRNARIVMGAVAPIPWHSSEAEKVLVGAQLDRDAATRAAEAALKPAAPLRDNGYKVAIAKVLIRRALMRAGGVAET